MLNKLRAINVRHKMIVGGCLVIGILIVSLLQDFAHSQVRNYHFYFSESLLYNSFWLLFAPFILIQIRIFERLSSLSKSSRDILKYIVTTVIAGIHLIVFPLIVVSWSQLFFEQAFRFQSVLDYELSEHLYVCASIYLSIGTFLIFRNGKDDIMVENNLEPLKMLLIQKGTERISVLTDSIYCITAEAPYVAIHTFDKKYLYSDTLTSLMSKLDTDWFIRIHKSTIIHMEKMSSYTSRKNGDYDVLLTNGLQMRMSRTYTAEFKRKIQ